MHRILKRKKYILLFLCFSVSTIFMSAKQAYARTGEGRISGSLVNLREGPGTNTRKVTALTNNSHINILEEKKGSDGRIWYLADYGSGKAYVRSDLVRFQESVKLESNFEEYLNQQGFPESYKTGLRELHQNHPNWIFTATHTGLDFSYCLDQEMIGTRSLVQSSSISSYKSTDEGKFDWINSSWPGFDGASWVAASREITAYYMDPRNFLDDKYIFQFESQRYKNVIHKPGFLSNILKGTFMESDGSGSFSSDNEAPISNESPSENNSVSFGDDIIDFRGPLDQDIQGSSNPSPGTGSINGPKDLANGNIKTPVGPGNMIISNNGINYNDIIMKAAAHSGVSPYVLASMILQEQGKSGKSRSISGADSRYPSIYNFFNVGAYQDGNMDAVTRGLYFASQNGNYGRPWNSIDKSIVYGAEYYSENYLRKGQDTLYLKKWNVQGSNIFKHQYMTNVQGAAGEALGLSEAYKNEAANAVHEFKIPVYKNMPTTASPKPSGDGNPNNKLIDLNIDGFMITPDFNMNNENYTLIVDTSIDHLSINAVPAFRKASVNGGGTISLNSDSTVIPVTVTAENGSIRTYTITVNKQSGAAVYNGSYINNNYGNTQYDSNKTNDGPGIYENHGGNSGNNDVKVEIGVGPL